MTQLHMNRSRAAALLFVLVILGCEREPVGQEFQIGIIDFYELNRVSATLARQALTFKEGDTISLADDIVQADDEFSKALMAAAQSGETAEDDSQGYAFAHDPVMRAIQERFVTYAARDLPELRRVLRNSSDPEHRALAAQILSYAANKQAVVEDLVHGMSDPSEDVRNNAMRALMVFANAAPPVPRIPYHPFIALLNSPVWSDRNKAAGALKALSKDRDPQLLARLRNEAIAPLVEMARWKSDGHALFAFIILGRIAGYSDQAALVVWDRGEREIVIIAALNRH